MISREEKRKEAGVRIKMKPRTTAANVKREAEREKQNNGQNNGQKNS